MELCSVLPVVASDEGSFFVTRDGRAVWPLRTGGEREALQRLVSVTGCELREVAARVGRSRPNRAAGEVVALGEELREPADLYAHLTRRRLRVIDDLRQIVPVPGSVIVLSPTSLRAELFETLDRWPGTFPGILCADSPEALRRQVLIRAAAAVLGGKSARTTVDFQPLVGAGVVDDGVDATIGGLATPSEVRELATGGCDVLSVTTHGDGIDVHFGAQLTLCPMNAVRSGAPENRAPYCRETGRCIRHPASVHEARAAGKLIHPDELSARIIVIAACHGVLPPDGSVDPRWGLLLPMLDSGGLGAVVTTWNGAIAAATSTSGLLRALRGGASVGDALRRFNRSAETRLTGLRLCLFGDPMIRLPSAHLKERFFKQAHSMAVPNRHPPQQRRALGNAAFLRAYLRNTLLHTEGTATGAAQAALASVDVYETIAANGLDPEAAENGKAGANLRNAVLGFLRARGTLISQGWFWLASRWRVMRPSSCFNCDSPTFSIRATLRPPAAPARRLSFCPRCDVIEDVSAEAELSIKITNSDTIELAGTLPTKNWHAALLLGCQSIEESHYYQWPSDERGGPARQFSPPVAWPPGPLKVTLVMMNDANLSILSVPGRRNDKQTGTTNTHQQTGDTP